MPWIPGAVCGSCHCEMRPDANGVRLEMRAQFGPYYKIQADRWRCPQCGGQVYIGFAARPYAEHWQQDYDRLPVDDHAVLAGALRAPAAAPDESFDVVGFVTDLETGELSQDEIITGFQHMIDSGSVWELQGSYGRTAQALIDAGLCRPAKGARQ